MTCALAILGIAAPALASAGDDAAPAIVLDPGVVIARATLEGAPLSIAPDLWIGATDRLTLGATSSEAARGWVGAGRGLCLRAGAHGCDARFRGAPADARSPLHAGAPAIGGGAGLPRALGATSTTDARVADRHLEWRN